jgi:anti-sigma factor RsiW
MNTGSISHIPEDLLEEYAMGRLSHSDRSRLHRHLLLCSPCQAHLQQIDEYVKVIQAATAALRMARSDLAVLRKPPNTAWAAGFAVLVLLVIPYYRGNVTTVTLTAERGAFSMPHARAGHVLLKIDVTQIHQENGYQLEVVNANGRPIWHASVEATRNQIATEIPKRLRSGRYWIRLYDTGSPWTLLREYGLEVE